MKTIITLLIAIGMLSATRAQEFNLVRSGKPTCRMIIPETPTPVEIQAAKVLQDYIQRISGAILPIGSDTSAMAGNEILIGHVNRRESKSVPQEKLGKDGLLIRSTRSSLLITGGTDRGVLYGVYTFLEKYLGCRKYSSSVAYTPNLKTITIQSVNDLELPAFSYREDFFPDAYDQEYLDWHKLDSHFTSPGNGNKWGSWVHTFDHLLSTKDYGQTHPEYFSFYRGQRHAGQSPSGEPEAQLCLTNPEVFDIVCRSLRADTVRNPRALYWSVSQNDNVNYCRDPKCVELDEKYAAFLPGSKMYKTHTGSYSPIGMGSMLSFINRVADSFPDRIISTAAYQYTRVPPKDILPRKNVNIMLCNIESPRNVPIEKGDTSFCSDLIGWTHLTNNILIWDYVVQFRNLVSPFPNLRTLQPNLKYLHDNGVQAIFEEGNPETGGEFAELRAYLLAKLLWNPNVNIEETMDDFLSGYYGKASKTIRQYIDLLHDRMEQSGVRLIIYGTPVEEKDSFLSDSLIAEYNRLFDTAEKSVSGSPEILKRVRTARLPVYYAMLEIARSEKTGKRGAFIAAGQSFKPDQKIVSMLYDFVYGCIRSNVSHLSEGRTTPREYLDGYMKFLEEDPSVVNK